MDAKWKPRCLAVGLILVAGMGCNPLLFPFLLGRDDTKLPAEYALKQPPEKMKSKDDAKVLILVSTDPGSTEMIGIDKTISYEVVRTLDANLKLNKEKVTVLPAQAVEKWKSDNPNWNLQSPMEIGQKFKVDYVVNLEIRGISLYEPKTRNQYLCGRAAIEMYVYDMAKGSDIPEFKTELNQEYPKGRPVDVGDVTVSKFQSEFVKKIANEISWKLTAHEQKDRFQGD